MNGFDTNVESHMLVRKVLVHGEVAFGQCKDAAVSVSVRGPLAPSSRTAIDRGTGSRCNCSTHDVSPGDHGHANILFIFCEFVYGSMLGFVPVSCRSGCTHPPPPPTRSRRGVRPSVARVRRCRSHEVRIAIVKTMILSRSSSLVVPPSPSATTCHTHMIHEPLNPL